MKASPARCWLEGMLGKAVKKGAGREQTPLPGPGVPAAGGQTAWGQGVRPTLPPLRLQTTPGKPGQAGPDLDLDLVRKILQQGVS